MAIDFGALAARADIRGMYMAPDAEQLKRSYDCLCAHGECSPDGMQRHAPAAGGNRGTHFCSNDRSFQALVKAGLVQERTVRLGRVSGSYSVYTLLSLGLSSE